MSNSVISMCSARTVPKNSREAALTSSFQLLNGVLLSDMSGREEKRGYESREWEESMVRWTGSAFSLRRRSLFIAGWRQYQHYIACLSALD